MAKDAAAVSFCSRCHLPINPGASTARGEAVPPRHITVPGQPTDCPEPQSHGGPAGAPRSVSGQS